MTEIKTSRLTKKGLPDKRAETSKINMRNAQKKAAQMIHAIKEKNRTEFVSESEDSSSSESESEQEEEIPEEKVKSSKKLKKRDILYGISEKLDKLVTKPSIEIPVEPKIEIPEELKIEIRKNNFTPKLKF